ncbi:hypothetical protein K474DRAFT_1411570 [Panus rudis PR-1116 ss-1]|nr:hypothetical protein K474DRAFT_1411570 [Panus rudis PR-1116 ss-1]
MIWPLPPVALRGTQTPTKNKLSQLPCVWFVTHAIPLGPGQEFDLPNVSMPRSFPSLLHDRIDVSECKDLDSKYDRLTFDSNVAVTSTLLGVTIITITIRPSLSRGFPFQDCGIDRTRDGCTSTDVQRCMGWDNLSRRSSLTHHRTFVDGSPYRSPGCGYFCRLGSTSVARVELLVGDWPGL